MNAIDLIVCLVLVVAVWSGWQKGFVVQLFSLAGLVLGIWLASRYGSTVGGYLRLDEQVAAPGGFVTVLVVALVAVAVVARLVRGICRFAGLGMADIVLGVAVSVLKYVLLLGVLFSAFDTINADYSLIGQSTIDSSRTYRPAMRVADAVFPFLAWIGEQIPENKN